MKALIKKVIGLALAGLLYMGCAGSYYVTQRPVEPVYERPTAPYPGAVWAAGEWSWRGGRYVYTNGYWTRPRGTKVYISGAWEQRPGGYYWRHGHWK